MKFFLNNELINPLDGLNVGLRSDFKTRSNPQELQLTTLNLILPRKGVEIINEWKDQYGLGVGIPAHIQTKNGTVIRYYVDLWSSKTKPKFKVIDTIDYKGITASVSLKRRDSNFFDRAESWSFERLAKKGVNFNTVDVLYVIIKNNAVELGVTLSLAGFNAAREVINQTIQLVETIRATLEAANPNIDILENVEDIASAIILATFQVIAIGLLLFALIKLSQQFFELIFPKVRKFKACRAKELMEKSANYFGYQFKSDLLDAIPNLTILPIPLIKGKESFWDYLQNDLNFAFTKGYPTASDTSIDMVGKLFSAMEETFNAATKVKNGIVEFEIWNYWQNITQDQIDLTMNLKEEAMNEYSHNTEDGYSRMTIKHQSDFSDLHTIDFFDPTTVELATENTIIPPGCEDIETITGFKSINSPFSIGVRKKDFNWLENVAKVFFTKIDNLVNGIGDTSSFAAKIDTRKGVIQISQQFFSNPKLLYIVNGRQPENYVDIIGADALYENYHKSSDITNQASLILENVPIRLKDDQLLNLYDNNFINNGTIEVLDVQFFDEKEVETETTATIKVYENWSQGKQVITKIE